MDNIQIKRMEETPEGWLFLVEVGNAEDMRECLVGLGPAYWKHLTGGREAPESLVTRSFRFLLAREPKEAILKQFNLDQIQEHFSNYEGEIMRRL